MAAGDKVIARLVGKLAFESDLRPLMNFEKRLDSVNTKLKQTIDLTKKKISLKIGIDNKSLAANLKAATNTKIVFKNVAVSEAALSALVKSISTKLDTAKVSIKDIQIPTKAILAQKKLMRSLLESTTIDLPIDVKMKAADAKLRAWKKATEAKFKLHLEADISRQKLYRNVRNSLKAVNTKLGTITIGEPKIKLKVDHAALKIEIANVLKQIEREAKIKIQLNGNVGGNGGSSGGFSSRHATRTGIVGGGIAGAAGHMGRGFIPGLGAAFAVTQLNQINQQMQAQDLALNTVMAGAQPNNANAGAQQRTWFNNLADQMGINVRETLPSFTKMMASGTTSGYGVDEVQNIFTGISAYGRTMGLDSESMKGTMRAVEQMMNKGQIYSEELKGQLAERAPGVISAMAEAAGLDPVKDKDAVSKLFKMMEDGELKSKDVLEKFGRILYARAEQGGGLAKAMEATAAQQARFQNAFDRSVRVFAAGGFDQGMATYFKNAADAMERATPLVNALGAAFIWVMRPVNAFVRILGDFGEALPDIANWMGVSEAAITKLGIGALLAATPLGRIVGLISGAVLAIDDLVTHMKGGQSHFGDWFNSLSDERQARLTGLAEKVALITENLGKLNNILEDGDPEQQTWFSAFIDDLTDSAAFDVLDMMIEKLKIVALFVTQMANGQFGDAMITLSSTVARMAGGLGDVFVPGTPMTSTLDAIGVPNASKQLADIQQKYANQKALAGNSMVPGGQPITIQNMQLDMKDVTNPAEFAEKLTDHFKIVQQQQWREELNRTKGAYLLVK